VIPVQIPFLGHGVPKKKGLTISPFNQSRGICCSGGNSHPLFGQVPSVEEAEAGKKAGRRSTSHRESTVSCRNTHSRSLKEEEADGPI
jgi:hypothetical protein